MKGPPTVALPPAQVLINPADAAPPSAEDLLDTPDDKVNDLWPAKDNERVPTINLPGKTASSSGPSVIEINPPLSRNR